MVFLMCVCASKIYMCSTNMNYKTILYIQIIVNYDVFTVCRFSFTIFISVYISKYIQCLKQVFVKELKYVMKIDNDFNDRAVSECRVGEWFIVLLCIVF